MSCKFANAPPIYTFPKPNNQSTKTLTPKSIPIKSTGARSAARIKAFYAPAAAAVPAANETLYELLGIAETGSSTAEIKRAYKQMARKYHPDVSPPGRVDEHTRRFVMVRAAYEVLSDPRRRALYDRDLAKGMMGFEFDFSDRRTNQREQRMEEKGEWKMRWQSQLEELKRRSKNPNSRRRRMPWAARMPSQT